MRATFDASRAWWNIDSPANRPPIATPYRPPTSSPSRQVSTECAHPRAWRSPYARRMSRGDPPAGSARVGAGRDHRVEGGVDADLEPARGLPHRARHPQPVQRQHAALHRRPPAQHPAPRPVRHREEPRPVGRQQRRGLEVGAGGQQVVVGQPPGALQLGEVGEHPRRRCGLPGHGRHCGRSDAGLRVAAGGQALRRETDTTQTLPDLGDSHVSVRSAIAGKLIPDVHRVAPNANRGFVQQAEIKAINGVGPLPPAAAAAEKQLEELRRRRRPGHPRGHREPRPALRRPGLRDQPRRPRHHGRHRPGQHLRPGAAAVPHGRRHRAPARLRPRRPPGAQRRSC